MDLGICPGCGEPWIAGTERCDHCGYIPIGAGIKVTAQAIRDAQTPVKRRRPFVAPVGSWAGYLVSLIAFLTLAFAADVSPWRNDWEFVRVLFGDPASRSVTGAWQVTRAELLDTSGLPVALDRSVRGTFVFGDNGRMRLSVSGQNGRNAAAGDYSVHGNTLYLRNLRNDKGVARSLPTDVAISLDWQGEDDLVMDVIGHEVIYLQRSRSGR